MNEDTYAHDLNWLRPHISKRQRRHVMLRLGMGREAGSLKRAVSDTLEWNA